MHVLGKVLSRSFNLLCSHNTVGRKRGKEKFVSPQLKGKNYQYDGNVLK